MTDEETRATPALQRIGVPFQVVVTQPASSAEESAQFQGIELQQLLRDVTAQIRCAATFDCCARIGKEDNAAEQAGAGDDGHGQA